MIDLRYGDYRTALADVERVDALITDPPYGERTHAGQRHGRKDPGYSDPGCGALSARGLSYKHWTAEDVREFVDSWAPRTAGWFCAFTSHDLIGAYTDALRQHGRYVFAPLACVQNAMNVRLAGDGPSNWTTWLVVSRTKALAKWGALPGAYTGASHDGGQNSLDRSQRIVAGGKPLWLMRAVVRDYSRPGDLVCDPCAGGATTLIAAQLEHRRAIGAELDPETFAKASARIAGGSSALRSPQQERLL